MSSSRLAIMQGMQKLLAGVTNPATSALLYNDVRLGAYIGEALKQLVNYTSFAEVAFFEGKSGPAGSGGNLIGWRIEDMVTLSVISGWDYEADSTAAMVNAGTAMDIILPLLHSHVVIPDPNNPSNAIASVWSVLTEQPDRAIPVRIPNGHIYLLWHVYVAVKQQYNVTLTVP